MSLAAAAGRGAPAPMWVAVSAAEAKADSWHSVSGWLLVLVLFLGVEVIASGAAAVRLFAEFGTVGWSGQVRAVLFAGAAVLAAVAVHAAATGSPRFYVAARTFAVVSILIGAVDFLGGGSIAPALGRMLVFSLVLAYVTKSKRVHILFRNEAYGPLRFVRGRLSAPMAAAAHDGRDLDTIAAGGLGTRLGSFLIDVGLLVAATVRLQQALLPETSFGQVAGGAGWLYAAMLVAAAAYAILLWTRRGATLGQMAMDLRVITPDGRRPTMPVAAIRLVGLVLSIAVVCLGVLWIAFDRQRRGWHDRIAGTRVISDA